MRALTAPSSITMSTSVTSHKDEVMKITPNYLENLEYADIVRGSA
jgi:hypothetical protein